MFGTVGVSKMSLVCKERRFIVLQAKIFPRVCLFLVVENIVTTAATKVSLVCRERSQTKTTSRPSDTQVPLGPALWCEGEGPLRDAVVRGEGRSAVWDVI